MGKTQINTILGWNRRQNSVVVKNVGIGITLLVFKYELYILLAV